MDRRSNVDLAKLAGIFKILHDTHVLQKFVEHRGHQLSQKQLGMIVGTLDTLRWLCQGQRDPLDCLLVDILTENRGQTLRLEIVNDAALDSAYDDERDLARTALFFQLVEGYGDTWIKIGEDGQREYLADNTDLAARIMDRAKSRGGDDG